MKHNLLDILAQELMLDQDQVKRLIARAPHSYKTYYISKKSGGRRKICQPAKEIKAIQNIIVDKVLVKLPVHEAATAYKQGASIKKNAQVHVGNTFISKYDFKSFFTSIKGEQIKFFLVERHNVSPEDAELIVRICCIKGRGNSLHLSIGAPSSPALSNVLMYEFDQIMTKWAKDNLFTYSRYADDMTFSTNQKDKYHLIDRAIRKAINNIEYLSLRLNRKKTLHLSKRSHRSVTGIVINNNGELSLGRDRKRIISSMIHHYKSQQLLESELPRLQGLVAFAKDVEPTFFRKMIDKYGGDTIKSILQHRIN